MESRIEIIRGDITTIKVDAVVNAANSSLMGGGGVDGAIHRKGGKAILEECVLIRNRIGSLKTGNAVITTAGNLPASYVIHTVGPVWNGGVNDEDKKLGNCYFNSLKTATENNIRTIAFPNISTGIFGFPKERAVAIACNSVLSFLSQNKSPEKVFFVCFDEENFSLYSEFLIQN